MDFKSIEERYYQKKQEGMESAEIRIELQKEGLGEEEIQELIGEIDNQFLTELIHSRANEHEEFDLMPVLGMVMVAAGIFLMIATDQEWIDLGDNYRISGGSFLAGLGIITRSKLKRPSIFRDR